MCIRDSNTIDWENNDTFWVMPDEGQTETNRDWISKTFGASLSNSSIYIAPQYKKTGGISDPSLLAQIEECRPNSIFIQGWGCAGKTGFISEGKFILHTQYLLYGSRSGFFIGRAGKYSAMGRFSLPRLVASLCSSSEYFYSQVSQGISLGLFAGEVWKLSLIHISEPTRPY